MKAKSGFTYLESASLSKSKSMRLSSSGLGQPAQEGNFLFVQFCLYVAQFLFSFYSTMFALCWCNCTLRGGSYICRHMVIGRYPLVILGFGIILDEVWRMKTPHHAIFFHKFLRLRVN